MITAEQSLPSKLLDERAIRDSIASLQASIPLGPVAIGVLAQGQQLHVAVGFDPVTSAHHDAGAHSVPTGCLTQALTATLLAEAAAEGQLRWNDSVADCLPLSIEDHARLARVTVADLMRHSHGLDESSTTRVVRGPDGLLDSASLAEGMTTFPPIFAPGTDYSYGFFGEYLARAVLERVKRRPYAEILRDGFERWREMQHDALSGTVFESNEFFPARSSISAWLSLLELHLPSHRDDAARSTSAALAALREDVISLPGWHPEERAACLGWKCYDGGWYGHNSALNNEAAAVRFNPERRLAVVICTAPLLAAYALSRIFEGVYPPIAPTPARLQEPAASTIETQRYVGVYTRGEMSIHISCPEDRVLRLNCDQVPPCRLRPAENHVFLADPFLGTRLPVVQFVSEEPDRRFRFLWNGRQLYRRSDARQREPARAHLEAAAPHSAAILAAGLSRT